LGICIGTNKVNAIDLAIHHMLHRIAAPAANTDDFDDRVLRLVIY
jgi:hypothetical protein